MAKRDPVREEDVRKRAEAVFIVQIFGALLLLPPLLNLFNTRTLLFGVPLEVLYIFLVWTALIVCAVIISAKMPGSSADSPIEHNTAQTEADAGGAGK